MRPIELPDVSLFNTETIVIKCMALLFSVQSYGPMLSLAIKQMMPTRHSVNAGEILTKVKACPPTASYFVGAFEVFASTPDFADPTADLNRNCTHPPITTTTTTTTTVTTTTTRNAGGTRGHALLSLVVVSTVCRMLLL